MFPSFGIRFIAVQDNVDTENRDSNAMEMMPIMNVFNEWHAANTSKKIRAVFREKAREGVLHAKKAAYGYVKGTDAKRTLAIDEETAPVVRRIFEMYASGITPNKIAQTLNEEKVPSPERYACEKYGFRGHAGSRGLWAQMAIVRTLNSMVYLGHMPQLRTTSVSYKNHKTYRKDQSEWVIVYNTHEPIISQELWDKVHERMKSVAQGRKTKSGYTHPLSGFLFCADCGCKMKMRTFGRKALPRTLYAFNCRNHEKFGNAVCFSHFITAKAIEKIVLDDIRTMAQRITLDEDAIRKEYMRHNAELADKAVKSAKKEVQAKKKRIDELSRLIQLAYEDRAKGKMPEEVCFGFIEKYLAEQKTLITEVEEIKAAMKETETAIQSADDFIRDIKKYLNAPTLTREMCYELIDCIVVGGLPKATGKARTIDIVYKVDFSSVIRYKFEK